jgi:general secretion pathway protein K
MKSNLNIPAIAHPLASERGVVLVVVLWIFIFLFVVAFDFSAAVREEATAANRYKDDVQGYYLALAGFERGLYDFLNQSGGRELRSNEQPKDLFDGSWTEEQLGEGVYRVRLVDESGKININRIDEETLRRIFANLGVEEPRRSILVDSIMDWRDPDNLHRVNGAENDYYQSLPAPYTAKNGPLDTIEDLLWIRGMTNALYHGYREGTEGTAGEAPPVGLREIFTVDSTIDRVNLRSAPPEVIHAVTGIPLDKCRALIEERKKLSSKTLADLLRLLGIGAGDAAQRMFVFTNPTVISVEAEGQNVSGAGAPRRVKALVRASAQQRFELARWVDREAALPKR